MILIAHIAQLVERTAFNRVVAGSIPAVSNFSPTYKLY